MSIILFSFYPYGAIHVSDDCAGQLKDILWSVNFFQEDEAERMPANYSREKKQLEQEGWKTSPFAWCDVFLKLYVVSIFFKAMVKSIDNTNQPPTTTHHHHNSKSDNKNKRKKLYSPREIAQMSWLR